MVPIRAQSPLNSVSLPQAAPAAASTTAFILAPANTSRFELEIFNNSTATLFISKVQGLPTSTTFSISIIPGAYYQTQYKGVIFGFWQASGSGSAMITDTSMA